MLSNFHTCMRVCRLTSFLFVRPLNISSHSNRISRGFAFDVAPILKGLQEEKIDQKTRPRGKIRSTISERKDVVKESKIRESTNRKLDDQKPKSPVDLPHWVQTPVDLAIFKAENPDELWNVASKYQFTGVQAVGFFANLAKLTTTESDINYEKIMGNEFTKNIFDMVIRAILAECETFAVGEKVLALRSLLHLGVPGDHDVMVRLRKTLSKNFHLLSPSSLLSFAVFNDKYVENTNFGKHLQMAMLDRLRSNTNQFTDPNDLLLLFTTIKRRDSSGWFDEIEAKILETLPSFTGEQLLRLVNVLATKRSRSLPLLKCITNHYAHCKDDLSLKKLVALLSDLCTLNYPNLKILTTLLRDIESKVQTATKPTIICEIFSSLAIMRIRHVELLQTLCEWVLQHLNALTGSELASVLVALARCNFSPSSDLISQIAKKLSLNFFAEQKSLWLDVVWALAILQRLTKEHAASVLDKSFYEPLLKEFGNNDYKYLVSQLKLRNIDTAVRLEVTGYQGPVLDVNGLKEITQINVVQYKEDAVKMMTSALNNLAPNKKYMKTEVTSPSGYIIDALLHVGADGKPLPISQWNDSSRPVAFVVRHFYDLTQMSDSIIGLHAMATRHLKALGYVVIEIAAVEMDQRRQPLARVQYLNEKLTTALKNSASSKR